MTWIYNKKKITCLEDLPNYETLEGFVYKITNLTTGLIYIGKKSLLHNRRARISKREKAATATRKVFKKISKDSGWLEYYGSCIDLKNDIKLLGKEKFKREILELCCTKKYLNYCELEYQIKYDVLKTKSYNGNILGKFFHRDMENCKEK